MVDPSEFEYYRHGKIGVASIRKAASSSMQAAFFGISKPLSWRKNDSIPNIEFIAFVREPVERLQSCYKFFANGGKFRRDIITHTTTYSQFVDKVLDNGVKNIHWNSQGDYLEGLPRLTCYPFENLEMCWNDLGLPKLPHLNWSPPQVAVDDPAHRIDELKLFYKKDYRLRDNANRR